MKEELSATYKLESVPQRYRTGRFPLWLLGSAMAAFAAGYIIVPGIAALILTPESSIRGIMAAAGPILSLLTVGVLARYYAGSFRKGMLYLGFRRFPCWVLLWGVFMAGAIMLCGGGVTLVWGFIAAQLNIDLGTPPTVAAAFSENIWDVIALMTTALFAAPVFEEIFFRRVIYCSLLKFLPPVSSIGLASLAFSALHLSPLQLPGLLLVGWIWQNFYIRSKNLWTSVILHFFNNLIAAGMLLLFRFTEFTEI